MPAYRRFRGAVSGAELARMREALLSSRFVSKSPLAGTFHKSRGFAACFTRDGVGELRARFPCLEPFIARVLDPTITRELLPWPLRLAGRSAPAPNAFYLNLLLLGPGDEVGAHVDATLRDASGVSDALPELVSVLYLETPPVNDGGELLLWQGAEALGALAPSEGTLVLFAGHLRHAVRDFDSDDASALRASLVCEQYALPDEGLARMPRFSLHTRGGFSAWLDEGGARRAAP